ncbi:MAG: tripartite tricarboxylate transporter TctB family protein [Bacillota bacterium]
MKRPWLPALAISIVGLAYLGASSVAITPPTDLRLYFGTLSPYVVPRLAGALLIIASLLLAWREGFAPRAQAGFQLPWSMSIGILGTFLLYGVLLKYLGFFIPTCSLVLFQLKLLVGRLGTKQTFFAICYTLVVFFVFGRLIGLPLPTSPLGLI